MADLAKAVDYEQLFPLRLKHPTKEGVMTGVVMMIRSAGSERARQVLRKHLDANIDARLKGKNPGARTFEKNELEKAASYIASWEWGKDENGEQETYGGEVPELNMHLAIKMLDAQPWMFDQIVEAASKIENFSETSPKS